MSSPTPPPPPQPGSPTDWTNRWSDPPQSALPRRRIDTRRIIGTVAIAAITLAVAAAGVAAGWALRGAQHDTHQPGTSSAAVATQPPPLLTPEQAKVQACNAYAVLGPLWSSGYHEWATAVATPGWQWDDPKVRDATDRFRATQGQVVTQINELIAPTTPPDVRDAISDYTSAILTYAAGFGVSTADQMKAQEHAIDAAAAHADQVCGLPTG